MSWEATTWAVKQTPKNAAQKLVLILLANHTNGKTGQCNPSHRLLAQECCMSLSTLKVHIESLAEAGLLKIHRRFREQQQLPNQYFLLMGAEAQLDPDNMDSDGVVSVVRGGRPNLGGGSNLTPTPAENAPHPSPQNSATEPGSSNLEGNQPPNPLEGGKKPRKPRAPKDPAPQVTLKTWLETIKAKGEMAIPETHSVFEYAEKVKMPQDYVGLAWKVFKNRYTATDSRHAAKRYKDWRLVFLAAVKENWLKLWWWDAKTGYALTTAGAQSQLEHTAKAEPEAVEA